MNYTLHHRGKQLGTLVIPASVGGLVEDRLRYEAAQLTGEQGFLKASMELLNTGEYLLHVGTSCYIAKPVK